MDELLRHDPSKPAWIGWRRARGEPWKSVSEGATEREASERLLAVAGRREALTDLFGEPTIVRDGMRREAVISPCGCYRYRLTRQWADGAVVCFVMLNPSTADGDVDDPTIRRCIAFAKSWGFAGIEVVNLYAWRATDPKELDEIDHAISPDNDRWIEETARSCALVVAAWGACRGEHWIEADRVSGDLQSFGVPVKCLGLTKGGQPRHPLYVRGDAKLIDYDGE